MSPSKHNLSRRSFGIGVLGAPILLPTVGRTFAQTQRTLGLTRAGASDRDAFAGGIAQGSSRRRREFEIVYASGDIPNARRRLSRGRSRSAFRV